MKPMSCRTCGAELWPDARFCRKCGTAISVADSALGSEQPTTMLREADGVATQQLSSRATAGQREMNIPPNVAALAPTPSTGHSVMWRGIIIGVAVVVLILAIASAVAVVRLRTHSTTATESTLVYPGSNTVLNITSEGGGRAIQLKTTDSFEKVVAWYQQALKPEKALHLTSSTVVMKNEKATATIVGGDKETNVVIKVLP